MDVRNALTSMIILKSNNKVNGLSSIQGNYYRNIHVDNSKATKITEQSNNIYTITDFKTTNLQIVKEVYRGIKAYTLIMLNGIESFTFKDNMLRNIYTPDICSKLYFEQL